MNRFWMGDEGVLDDTPCACGRTYPLLPKGVYGRLDDMLLIRRANIYPSAVESVVRAIEGTSGGFRIIVERPHDLDEMTVEVERAADLPFDHIGTTRTELEHRLRVASGVHVPVIVVEPGSHEAQTFKARHVIDRRPKN